MQKIFGCPKSSLGPLSIIIATTKNSNIHQLPFSLRSCFICFSIFKWALAARERSRIFLLWNPFFSHPIYQFDFYSLRLFVPDDDYADDAMTATLTKRAAMANATSARTKQALKNRAIPKKLPAGSLQAKKSAVGESGFSVLCLLLLFLFLFFFAKTLSSASSQWTAQSPWRALRHQSQD